VVVLNPLSGGQRLYLLNDPVTRKIWTTVDKPTLGMTLLRREGMMTSRDGSRGNREKRERNRAKRSRHLLLEQFEDRALLAVLFADGFKGAFPGDWAVENSGGTTTAKWGDNSAKAASGGWSAFVADNGSNTRTTYDNNLNTYMRRQGLSLSGYSTASLSFQYFLNSEANYDYFRVKALSQAGTWTTIFEDSGNDGSLGWQSRTINLDSYAGQTGVTISFEFTSGASIVPAGVAGWTGVR